MKEEKAGRTREEINREISDLRGWTAPRIIDWHEDANWPTLLREMPAFNLIKLPHFMVRFNAMPSRL
jgi:hypothetical protein